MFSKVIISYPVQGITSYGCDATSSLVVAGTQYAPTIR
jgi:hypothetical protein